MKEMRKSVLLLAILLLISLAAVIAYSIAMTIADVGGLGATDQVEVTCPAQSQGQSCQVDKIRWIIQANPLTVTKAKVYWTPQTSTGNDIYLVCVEVYDDSQSPNLLGYGCQAQSGSSSQVTTTVTLTAIDNSIDPRSVEYIKVAIAEQE